jgi:SAM-dependent methyltransferase
LILDLGIQPLANNLLRAEDLGKPEPKFPLRVFLCPRCWLLQITDLVPPVELFSEYLYFSSFSDAMLQHAKMAAQRYIAEFALNGHALVVEIASNDGYFLQNFQRAAIPCLGIEPAANIARVAREKGIKTVVDFFGEALAGRIAAEQGQADLILANNVFAHAPDINDFVRGLTKLLKRDGRVVLEFPYALDLIERTEFDTIYHEHVFYFALRPLVPLFTRHGLDIFRAERLSIHGGSLRIFAGHSGAHSPDGSVAALLDAESSQGMSSFKFYEGFVEKVLAIKQSLTGMIREARAHGRTVAAYGASAKGSTLLNFCGLGRESIAFVADRSSYKQGRFTPGMHLPIVGPEQLLARQPDVTLLLTWNFAEEILEQQKAYRKRGGQFIVPIPAVTVV